MCLLSFMEICGSPCDFRIFPTKKRKMKNDYAPPPPSRLYTSFPRGAKEVGMNLQHKNDVRVWYKYCGVIWNYPASSLKSSSSLLPYQFYTYCIFSVSSPPGFFSFFSRSRGCHRCVARKNPGGASAPPRFRRAKKIIPYKNEHK